MNYTRKFDTVEELDNYVDFQARENGLRFNFDRVAKRCWIEVEADTHRELREAEAEGRDE